MREAELWERMTRHLGPAYARVWAAQYVLAAVDGRTVEEALADGVPAKVVWRAVWEALELPPSER
ncbi:MULTISPECIES: DUF3046 domain-containing protein [Desertihabitans]|uniref:DUF3046 domain-containing protein n=1 Tax=Desertihabitans brevis TaxID=2268447 RepID=A0A367Z0U8_9ACTN|nr:MULTISPECIES: DUF3046 domain-containing protein [Desertihabitans]RCK71399.1 DUF3046 domain-containing protein [Desertihabitans brevis]